MNDKQPKATLAGQAAGIILILLLGAFVIYLGWNGFTSVTGLPEITFGQGLAFVGMLKGLQFVWKI